MLLLHLLSERPRHGYDVIREFKDRGSRWRPGAGSIYPTLFALETAGFVESRDEHGKRVYTITDSGLEHLKSHGSAAAESLAHDEDDEPEPVREAMRKLHAAAAQAASGQPETAQKVIAVLNAARKEIYTLLANE